MPEKNRKWLCIRVRFHVRLCGRCMMRLKNAVWDVWKQKTRVWVVRLCLLRRSPVPPTFIYESLAMRQTYMNQLALSLRISLFVYKQQPVAFGALFSTLSRSICQISSTLAAERFFLFWRKKFLRMSKSRDVSVKGPSIMSSWNGSSRSIYFMRSLIHKC